MVTQQERVRERVKISLGFTQHFLITIHSKRRLFFAHESVKKGTLTR